MMNRAPEEINEPLARYLIWGPTIYRWGAWDKDVNLWFTYERDWRCRFTPWLQAMTKLMY
jgi:hypothetical protein